jgi:hypothetical protein
MATFSFTNLIPDSCQIPSSVVRNLDSSQNITANPAAGLSAVFIALLIIVSSGLLLFTLKKLSESQLNVRAYFKLLDGMDQSDLTSSLERPYLVGYSKNNH